LDQLGVIWAHFGVLLEQFGVVLDKLGVVSDYFWSTNTPKNRVLNAKNKENTICARKKCRSMLIPKRAATVGINPSWILKLRASRAGDA